MPPGLGDTNLDVIRLIPRLEFLLVGNASRVVIESVRRALQLISELGVPIVGLVENMRRGDSDAVSSLARTFGAPFLGAIPFDPRLEDALGGVELLRVTEMYETVADMAVGL